MIFGINSNKFENSIISYGQNNVNYIDINLAILSASNEKLGSFKVLVLKKITLLD